MSSSLNPSDLRTLSTLLSHLSQSILSTSPSSPLRSSPYHRQKTSTNLEYARALLLTLEHQVSSIKVQKTKHALQEDLLGKRQEIKILTGRLAELASLDDGRYGSDDGEAVDEVLREVLEDSDDDLPASPTKVRGGKSRELDLGVQKSALLGPALRNRRPQQSSPTTTATKATGVLFQSKSPGSTTQSLEQAESLHSDLTSSLVSLAQQLKLSAQSFADDLDADKQTMSRTEDALGKNKDGIDSATAKMGVLRRMSEGRWWWGRMVLYAGIAVLWFVLILLVFVGPKIRF